jgi:hypothetical protein
MNDVAQRSSNGHHKAEVWTRIIGSVVGGLILALQGINISETNGQTSLIQRIDTALEQQSALIKEVNQEGVRIDKALMNQQEMIKSMETLLNNQNLALEILKKEQVKTP